MLVGTAEIRSPVAGHNCSRAQPGQVPAQRPRVALFLRPDEGEAGGEDACAVGEAAQERGGGNKQFKGTKAAAQALGISQRTAERYVVGKLKRPRKDLRGRLEREVKKGWQPQIRAKARKKAASTDGLVVSTRARFGFTAASGTTDDAWIRDITQALPPRWAHRLFEARDANEQQLQRIAAEGLAEMYCRNNNTRAHGLGVEFTDVEHIRIELWFRSYQQELSKRLVPGIEATPLANQAVCQRNPRGMRKDVSVQHSSAKGASLRNLLALWPACASAGLSWADRRRGGVSTRAGGSGLVRGL